MEAIGGICVTHSIVKQAKSLNFNIDCSLYDDYLSDKRLKLGLGIGLGLGLPILFVACGILCYCFYRRCC